MNRTNLSGGVRQGIGRVFGPVLVLIGLAVLDASAFGPLAMFGVRPALLLVFVSTVALQSGPWAGLFVGAVAGLLVDLTGGHLVGLSVLSYGIAAASAGLLSLGMFPDRWIIVASAVAVGTVTEQLLYGLGALAFGFQLSIVVLITRLLPVLLLYHLLLTPIVYPLGRSFSKSLHQAATDG